jgi:hypothetical protein
LYFGGALFDTYEKFNQYYSWAKMMKHSFVPEDIAMRGVALQNLHCVAVDRVNKVLYTPTNYRLLDKNMITEILKYAANIGNELEAYIPGRCIIQYVTLPEIPKDEDIQDTRESHAACLDIIGKDLWLLDCSEDCPINLTEDNDYAKEWLINIDYISVFKVEELQYSPGIIDPLADIWERIYRGEPAAATGGHGFTPAPRRTYERKCDRAANREGSKLTVGKRKSPATQGKPIKASSRGKVKVNKKDLNLQAYLTQAMKEQTQAATESHTKKTARKIITVPGTPNPFKTTGVGLIKKQGGNQEKAFKLHIKAYPEFPTLKESLAKWRDIISASNISVWWKYSLIMTEYQKMRKIGPQEL